MRTTCHFIFYSMVLATILQLCLALESYTPYTTCICSRIWTLLLIYEYVKKMRQSIDNALSLVCKNTPEEVTKCAYPTAMMTNRATFMMTQNERPMTIPVESLSCFVTTSVVAFPSPISWTVVVGFPSPISWTVVVAFPSPISWTVVIAFPSPISWTVVPASCDVSNVGNTAIFLFAWCSCRNDRAAKFGKKWDRM